MLSELKPPSAGYLGAQGLSQADARHVAWAFGLGRACHFDRHCRRHLRARLERALCGGLSAEELNGAEDRETLEQTEIMYVFTG
jgi:hypothetical protein